jgi:hypothetical protein
LRAYRITAAHQVAQQHRLARYKPAYLIEADRRPAQAADVVARGRGLSPAASAEIVGRKIALVG